MSDSGFRLNSDSDSDSELGPIEFLDNVNVDTSTTPPDAEPPQISPSFNSNSDVDTDTDYVIIPSPIPLQIPSSSTSSFISDPEYLGSTSMTTTTTANNINTNPYRGHAAWEAMERPSAAAATRHKRGLGARQHLNHKHRRHRHHARDRTNDVPFSRDVVLLLGLCLVLACVLIISIRPLALAWLDNS